MISRNQNHDSTALLNAERQTAEALLSQACQVGLVAHVLGLQQHELGGRIYELQTVMSLLRRPL